MAKLETGRGSEDRVEGMDFIVRFWKVFVVLELGGWSGRDMGRREVR